MAKVTLAKEYGKKAGTLREEQARLQQDLQEVGTKIIQKTGKNGEGSLWTAITFDKPACA